MAIVGEGQLRFRRDGVNVALPRDVIHTDKRDIVLRGGDGAYVD